MTPLHPITAVMVTLALMLNGCGDTHPEDEADLHAGEDVAPTAAQEPEDDIHIVLTPEELEEFNIQIATAGSRSIDIMVDLPGEIVMNPDGVAHVVARASGIVLDVFKTIGDPVKAGDTLAILESPSLAEAKVAYLTRVRENELAKIDLARAETVYENTQKLLEALNGSPTLDALRAFSDMDLGDNRRLLVSSYAKLVAAESVHTREASLFQKQIGSEAESLEAESAFKQAQAAFLSVRDDLAFTNERTLDQRRRQGKVAQVALLAAERNLHALAIPDELITSIAEQGDDELARYVITAPIDGVITDRHIVRGELMEQGDDIYTVADLTTVWVHLTVYQKDLPVLRSGQSTEVVAHHGLGQAQGTIQYVSPVISESTRTTTARIVLANPDGAWSPGLFVTGHVITETIKPIVAVPTSAIQTIGDEYNIFVQHEDGFEPAHVELGRGNDSYVEVLHGLEPGDAYVAVGGFALKAELDKASFEHAGHGH